MIPEISEKAEIRFMPQHSGDGYGYGGGVVLCIGRFAIPFGEHPDAFSLATEIKRRWDAASTGGEHNAE